MNITALLINEDLLKAELALAAADSRNILDRCREYIKLLTEYRSRLHKLRGARAITVTQSAFSRELVEQSRRSVRAAITRTVKESNRTGALLASFEKITAHAAAETFNRLSYLDTKWEARSGGVRSADHHMSVEEAVKIASELRLEAYARDKITFLPRT